MRIQHTKDLQNHSEIGVLQATSKDREEAGSEMRSMVCCQVGLPEMAAGAAAKEGAVKEDMEERIDVVERKRVRGRSKPIRIPGGRCKRMRE